MAPTPYIIGVPASFLHYKRHFKLPDDIWLVDLDTNKIIKPTGVEDLPPLPEVEGNTLKTHFQQVLASMSITYPQGGNNSSISMVESTNKKSMTEFNPLTYGNDVDSVDIATRISMVKLYHSPGLLYNFNEFTRTIRLFPRPVVAFQVNSFLHSRPKSSVFLTKFVRTQVCFLFFLFLFSLYFNMIECFLFCLKAVEYFAEWSLCPYNVAFIRVQNGVYDPSIIGDKHKWFSHQLDVINFKVWNTTPDSTLVKTYSEYQCKDDDSDNESDNDSDLSTSSSFSSLNEFVDEMCNASRMNSQFLGKFQCVQLNQFI